MFVLIWATLFFSVRGNNAATDLIQKPTVMIPPLTEGQQTTLTCTAPGLCSGSDPKITWTWRGAGEKDSHITGNITDFKTDNGTAVTQRHSSTLTFNSSAEHHGTKVTCKVSFTGNTTTEETVTLNVTYVKELNISGMTTVKKGDTLNLSCSVESFPPSLITWTKLVSNKKASGSAILTIPNVTEEDSGQYICAAQHLITSLNIYMEVSVTFFPRILKNSGCEVQSEVLTCVCLSEGFPLPTIKWPLLENHAKYSVFTSVSRYSVNSNVTVSVKDYNYTTVECASSNKIGEAKENLTIKITELKQQDLLKKLLIIVKQPQVFIAFMIGILLSAVTCCFARKCYRKKQKSSGTLEMVTNRAVALMDTAEAVDNDGTHDQEATEGGAEAAEAAEQSTPDGDVELKEVEYSNIDFSLLKRKSPTGREDMPETTETEYDEIKRQETEERRDDGGEDGEMLEGKEEVVMIGEEMAAEQEEGEDMALYSNVTEIMGEI